jgi:DNA-binding NarL/FixJ family response regulator
VGDPTKSRRRILYVDAGDESSAQVHLLLLEAAPDAISVVRARSVTAALRMSDAVDCAIVAVDALDDTALTEMVSLVAHAPSRALVMLTKEDDDDRYALAMESGATDCLARDRLTARGLVRAIRSAIVRKRLETSLGDARAHVLGGAVPHLRSAEEPAPDDGVDHRADPP